MNEEKNLTDYPSIDKPWLKCYEPGITEKDLPEGSTYSYMTGVN